MIYVIMCGGEYPLAWKKPKQLFEVNGETLLDRTIRLLKENGAEEIYISATDPIFDGHGVPRLEHENNFAVKGNKIDDIVGYWVDAFYPNFPDDTEVTYLFGDVWFTEEAIKRIVNCKKKGNVLFGTSLAKNREHKPWGEPFAYVVRDYKAFMDGVAKVKQMHDERKFIRHPIVWELYRVLNKLDPNVQQILDKTYECIDDGTMDADSPEKAEGLGR